jgi:galactonate dehydratase
MPSSRRTIIQSAFASVGLAALTGAELDAREKLERYAPIPAKDPLKITKVETFLVKPRWLFLKIHTNAGITGLGEPITEGRALTCAEAVKEIEPYLIGKDPRPVAKHWQAIYRHAFYRGGPILTSALSGIDQALWDIKGKALGVPVYELLGGPTRDRVRVYAHAGTPDQMKKLQAQGFTAFKTGVAKHKPRRTSTIQHKSNTPPKPLPNCARQWGTKSISPSIFTGPSALPRPSF